MNASQNQTPENASAGKGESLFEQVNWFTMEPRKKRWLVDGLLLKKGSSMLVGKPKAGKSTVAKNIAVAVLKGHSIFGRNVEIGRPGKVVYLQLEGKDDVAGTAEQFRALGVTAEEAKRLLIFQRSVHKGKMEERVAELAELLRTFPADLVVLDTLRLFTGKAVKDTNSYDDTVEAMDNVEPVLRKSGWEGHLSAVHHGRKDDEKKNQMLDSVLGSSGLAASVNTVILISHPDDDSPLRLICSKQNETERAFGDLAKTEVLMDEDTFALRLGRLFKDIVDDSKKQQKMDLAVKIQKYLADHPGCGMPELQQSVAARRKNLVDELALLVQLNIVTRSGDGTKKSPFTYALTVSQEGEAA